MNGKCYYCGKDITKTYVTRHLKACKKRAKYQEFVKNQKGKLKDLFLLQVNFREKPSTFWMYISVDENATLLDLDQFFRDVWCECCGHLSMFKINEIDYLNNEESLIESLDFQENVALMKVKLKKVLKEGMTFDYEYDFGDTTHLSIKVVERYQGYQKKKIEIMARNNPPTYVCSVCGKTATHYCYGCYSFFCYECKENDSCSYEDELMVEIEPGQNSPRCGVCGYVYDEYGDEDYKPLVVE